jgi:hypothetical protein
MTHSEELFETYLTTQNIRWERVPTASAKRTPDYFIQQNGMSHWFEVKEFDDPKVRPTGGFSPCPAVAEKIKAARKQFGGFKEDCCALVLHNCTSIYRDAGVSAVLSAAFGEYLQIEPAPNPLLHDEPSSFRFSGRSALDSKRNTTISAIVVLEHYQLQERFVDAVHEVRRRHANGEILPWHPLADVLQNYPGLSRKIDYQNSVRVRILENPFARFSFPRSLFCGPLDQLWGRDEKSGGYTLLSLGEELRRLRARPVKPVPLYLL